MSKKKNGDKTLRKKRKERAPLKNKIDNCTKGENKERWSERSWFFLSVEKCKV